MAEYFNLDKFVTDVMLDIPKWAEPFIREFDKPIPADKTYLIKKRFKIKRLGDRPAKYSYRARKPQRLDYETKMVFTETGVGDALLELQNVLDRFFSDKMLDLRTYNRIYSLAVILPYVVDKLKEKKLSPVEFNKSRKFLAYAIRKDVPPVYFAYLALILVVEAERFILGKAKGDKKTDMELLEVGLIELFHIAHARLFAMAKGYQEIVEEKMDEVIVVKSKDTYIQDGKCHAMTFFSSDGNPKTILIIGEGGSGKTVFTIRAILTALRDGYTVIIFVLDVSGEFKWLSRALTYDSNRQMYETLTKKQKEEPFAYPITIYTKNPILKDVDKDIKTFSGSLKAWKEIASKPQVVVFTDDFPRITRSLENYRSRDSSEKVLVVLNEAHELVDAFTVSGQQWSKVQNFNKFIIRMRPLGLPAILNTRYLALLSGMAKSSNLDMYVSHISDPGQQKKVADRYPHLKKDIMNYIPNRALLREKKFIHLTEERINIVKSLIPPCMLKNPNYVLEGGHIRLGSSQ